MKIHPKSKNLCEYLKAEISDTGNMLTNKVRIEFKDCYSKSLAILDGKSRSKDIEEGMQDALKNAMMNIPVSNPVKNAAAVQTESPVAENQIKAEEKKPSKKFRQYIQIKQLLNQTIKQKFTAMEV